MKKICVLSTSRADYGHLYFILKDIEASNKLDLVVFAPGNHHCIREIMQEFKTVQMTPCIRGIQDYGEFYSFMLDGLKAYNPDMVLVLGDRFETHAAATAALLLNISIAHIHGGETTTGSFDDNIRNAITMMADYHFTATEEYAKKVARMLGECCPDHYSCYSRYYHFPVLEAEKAYKNVKNIYAVGSPGIDWTTRSKLLSKQELQQYVSIDLNQPFVICCFHPETKDLANTERHIKEFCTALDKTGEQILFVMPNVDPCNNIIRMVVQSYDDAGKYSDCKPHLWHCVENLDHLIYLSLLQYAEMLIGNSSSGIIESASFNIPSISVGNRQEGRIKAANTFSCLCETEAILTAIGRAREWNALVGKCDNPYGDGRSSQRIVGILENL